MLMSRILQIQQCVEGDMCNSPERRHPHVLSAEGSSFHVHLFWFQTHHIFMHLLSKCVVKRTNQGPVFKREIV